MNTNEFVTKTVKAEDYELRNTFSRIDEVQSSVKLFVGMVGKLPKVVKNKENGKLYFIFDGENEVSPFVMAEERDGKFDVYALTDKALDKYGF